MLSMEARRRRAILAVVIVVLAVNLAFLARTFERDDVRPLSIGYTELIWVGNHAEIGPPLHNEGHDTVELLSARVPGRPEVTVQRPAEEWVLEQDRLLPVAGLKLKPNASERLEVVVPAECPSVPHIGSLEVRMRAGGREITQDLQMPRVVAPRCT